MSSRNRNTHASIAKLSLDEAISYLPIARECAGAERDTPPYDSFSARDALADLEAHILNLSLAAHLARTKAAADAAVPASAPADVPADVDVSVPTEAPAAAGELKMFCGYHVLDSDGRAANGLPRAILDTNGEAAYIRQRHGDAWWSIRDSFEKSGYRRLLGFEGPELADIIERHHRSIHDPSSREAMDRHSAIAPLMREAVESGCNATRVDDAVTIVAQGQLERAATLYGATTSACNCPAAQHQEGKCKHVIAMIMAYRLDWDPILVGDVVRWLHPGAERT